MPNLILLRHGQSTWNLENRFTGWTDVDLTEPEIVALNIPTGIPLLYELDEQLRPTRHTYLGDPEAAKKAAEAVADQGKA